MDQLITGYPLLLEQADYITVHEGAFLNSDGLALQILHCLRTILLANQIAYGAG
ncbi:hypothetical protein D3C73_1306460 [compost metagenome]